MNFDAVLAGEGRFLRQVRIPPPLAGAYYAFQLRRQRRVTQAAIGIGTATFIGLLGLDWFVVPDVFVTSVVTRAVAALIALGIAIFLGNADRSLRAQQAGPCFLALLYSAIACGLIASSQGELAPMYLTANNITVMFAVLILRFPTPLASAMACALIAIQSVALWASPFWSLSILICLNGISLSIAVPALYANWQMQKDQKRQFLAKQRDEDRVRTLSAQNFLLERLSALDPLTALSNRRAFDHVLASAVRTAKLEKDVVAVAVAMIDVDHFKLFNDRYGHIAGDDALRTVALELANVSRDGNLVARYGGEEFAIIMPNVSPLALAMIGARIRSSVERLQIPHLSNTVAKVVTVSIGISFAEHPELAGLTPPDLLQTADDALYEAKRSGRNRTIIAACVGSPDGDRPVDSDAGEQAASR